jgi:hypothetical protein
MRIALSVNTCAVCCRAAVSRMVSSTNTPPTLLLCTAQVGGKQFGDGVAVFLALDTALSDNDLYPVLLGTAFLAYSFGLRHAVDADHIAPIDHFVLGFTF